MRGIGEHDYQVTIRNRTILIYPLAGSFGGNISAIYGGEKRCPKKGEWYLSGAKVEAYEAPSDLSNEFHIARLVKVRRETIAIIEKEI